jgi:hypothetical protein
MSPLTIKSIKFESQIQDPMKHSQKTKSQQKAQKGHLEEGKAAESTNARNEAKQDKIVKKS